jgi:hypothetical protein
MSDTAQAQPQHQGTPPARPKKTRRRPHRLGPYSSVGALAGLDGRTWEYLYVKKCRRELEEHIGGEATTVQRKLIERASWLMLRLSMMDRRLAEDGGKRFTRNDSTQYLAWSNGLSRTLVLLDLTRGKGGTRPRFLRSRGALEALYGAASGNDRTIADLVVSSP